MVSRMGGLMVAEVFAGIGAFKTMFDMAQGLKEINDAAIRNSAVIALQEKILAAQVAQQALIARESELEAEVARLKEWEGEKKRYQLQKLPPGILMYRLKPGMEHGEPTHEICANCYNKGIKSLLHNLGEGNGLTEWKCHACGFHEHTGKFIDPNPPYRNEYF